MAPSALLQPSEQKGPKRGPTPHSHSCRAPPFDQPRCFGSLATSPATGSSRRLSSPKPPGPHRPNDAPARQAHVSRAASAQCLKREQRTACLPGAAKCADTAAQSAPSRVPQHWPMGRRLHQRSAGPADLPDVRQRRQQLGTAQVPCSLQVPVAGQGRGWPLGAMEPAAQHGSGRCHARATAMRYFS